MIKILMATCLCGVSLFAQTLIFEDDFESGLKSDWRVLSSTGGFTPQTTGWWGKKLRLTQNKHWQSNALTLDYEFPSKNNKFVIEFNHYAYGGDNDDAAGSYGGDGMAIILYDSLVGKTPAMGAFGGSLGYAQMRNDVTGDKQGGFEGGWLGIGLDEYGNFTNHNEGKRDRDGSTIYKEDLSLIQPNTVAIRGKQGSRRRYGYRKLASASVSALATTSSLGSFSRDKFRLSVDSLDAAHLYIKLERDRGSGYKTIIANFDAMDARYHQGSKPAYFRLAFAASTGGASNYHDIDNVKIWADAGWKYPTPHISIADVNVTEGDSAKVNAAFKVSLHEADPVHDTTIDFKTQDLTAEDEHGNHDYFSKSGSITIPKGKRSATINIKVDGDFQDESNESFRVILSNPSNGILVDANATGMIIDDDSYDNTKHYSCETEAFVYASKQVRDKDGVYHFDTPTDSYTIDLTTQESHKTATAFYPVNINAIGYSVVDNFIWGYDPANFKVTRTDIHNNVTAYTIAGLDKYMYHIGDVSPSGVLYLATAYLKLIHGVESNGIKRMYRVDVNPNSHTFLKELPSIDLSVQNLYSADWAFHPGDEQLYMVSRYNFDLIKINPETGKVDNLGPLLPYNSRDKGSHVQFFDRDGYFYFYSNDDFYRVDLTDPANPVVKGTLFSHLPLTSNGDAARCAYAPMQNAISISDESMAEGNSSTQMEFTLTLEAPAPAGGMEITYHTQEGSAKAGSDYVQEDPTPAKIKVDAGQSSASLFVDIITDKIEEYNENFEVNVTDTTMGTIGDGIGIGTILNDDKNATASIVFNVTDSAGSFDWDKNISTKIVNKDFALTILAKNDDNGSAMADVNVTQLDLVTCDGTAIASPWVYFSPQKQTGSSGLLDISNLSSSLAQSCAKVRVYGTYKEKHFSSISTDAFAIRPDHFVFNTPSLAVAGADFNLTVEARDYHDNKISNYAQTLGSSYTLTHQQQDAVNCVGGMMDITHADFVAGKITKQTNYSDVGMVDINISEIVGQEFAKVDAKDDATLVTIPSLVHTMTFTPATFDLAWELNNANSGYTIYSNDATAMGASLDVRVSARNAGGAIVHNYSGTCVAKDVNITVSFDAIGRVGEMYTMHIDDKNISTSDVVAPSSLTLPQMNHQFVYQTQGSRFEDGVSDAKMQINFARSTSEAREPLALRVKDINVNDANINKNLAKTKSVMFYYARAHAIDQGIVGKSLEATVDYEIYCKECDHSIFTLAENPESKDSVFWYIVPSSELSLNFSTLRTLIPVDSITQVSNNSVKITIDKLPHKNTVFYTPLSYLYHDKFALGGSEHKFKISFSSDHAKWAGKGDTGKSVELKTSQRKGDKIDW